MNMKTTYLLPALVGSALFAMAGCNPTGSVTNPTQTGTIVDSAVEGLEYSTASHSGTTGVNGSFQYRQGESIVFKVGDIELPAIPAEKLLTPLNLARTDLVNDTTASNIARFLQALDSDSDPSNGITIDTAAHQEALNASLDFSQLKADFEAEYAQYLNRPLPTPQEARDHFESTLSGLADGRSLREMINNQYQDLTQGPGYLSSEFIDTCKDLGALLMPGGLGELDDLFTMTACFNADDTGTIAIFDSETPITWSVDGEGGLLLSAEGGWSIRLVRLVDSAGDDAGAMVKIVDLPGYEGFGDMGMINNIGEYTPPAP